MLIFSPVAVHIDRLLGRCAYYARFFLMAVCGALLLILTLYSMRSEETYLPDAIKQKGGKWNFSYEAIGTGALALQPRYAFGWVSRIAQELVLIAYNSRPDVESKKATVVVSLNNGKEQMSYPNGSTIYLKEAQEGKALLVSEEPTNLWAKPILLDNGAVLIEAGRKFITQEGKAIDEKGQFVVPGQCGSSSRYSPSGESFAKALRAAKCYPKDLLIQKYGGSEYNGWSGKAVLELSRGNASYACFISSGDYLLYEGEEWRVCTYEELKGDSPIAYVKALTASAVEIDMWDESGYCPFQVKVDMEKPERAKIKPEIRPTTVRLRSGTQVSCAFGKKRMILRQGDWLLKTSSGWRNLRRREEIELFLYHRLKGDLLIFDSIEQEQGKYVMKGHIFDETRMQMHPITMPAVSDKAQGKSSRKRKPVFPHERRSA